MKRFKYMFSKKAQQTLLRMRIDLLQPEEKKRYKDHKLFSKIFITIYFTLMIAFLVLTIFLQKYIEPITGNFLFITIVVFSALILPGVLLIYPYIKLEHKYPPQSLGHLPNDIIESSNKALFKYYKISENYIVTKCYDCSNQLLIGKDLLLFFYKDRLRVVNDLTQSTKDFGCFEFKIEELELSYGTFENLQTTIIRSKGFFISCGKRANPFITKNIGTKYEKNL